MTKHIYVYSCLFITTSCCLIFLYWLFYPYKILEIYGEVKTDKFEYIAGERIGYTIKYCKFLPINAKVHRALVNGIRTNYTELDSSVTVGCKKVEVKDLIIPDFMDNGDYHIEITAEFKVNPVRTIRIPYQTNTFKVIAK